MIAPSTKNPRNYYQNALSQRWGSLPGPGSVPTPPLACTQLLSLFWRTTATAAKVQLCNAFTIMPLCLVHMTSAPLLMGPHQGGREPLLYHCPPIPLHHFPQHYLSRSFHTHLSPTPTYPPEESDYAARSAVRKREGGNREWCEQDREGESRL